MTTNELKLIKESGSGKMFNSGDDVIQVLQLQGSWREMGQQYGDVCKRRDAASLGCFRPAVS